MSTKNFVSYGDAETLFTGVGNKISGKQAKPTTISYADWLLLTPQQQETGNWLVTGVPGADLSLRVLALETNKQDKTDNNLQTTSKETTGAINELKSGLTNLTTWKYLTNISDNDAHTIGVDYRELFLIGLYGAMSLFVINGVGNARGGYYNSASDNGDFFISIGNGSITVNNYVVNGTEKVDQGVLVYYR